MAPIKFTENSSSSLNKFLKQCENVTNFIFNYGVNDVSQGRYSWYKWFHVDLHSIFKNNFNKNILNNIHVRAMMYDTIGLLQTLKKGKFKLLDFSYFHKS